MGTMPMRRVGSWRFAVLSMLFLAGPAIAKVEIERTDERTTMRFDVEDVRFSEVSIDGASFVKAQLVGIDGYDGILYQVGRPELPVIRFYADGQVTVKAGAATESGLLAETGRVLPAQPSRIKAPVEAAPLVLDQAAYAAKTPIPSTAFTIESAGSIRGLERHLVTLHPLSYTPATGAWSLTRSFEVTIEHPASAKQESGREIFAFIVGANFKNSPSLAAYMDLKEELGYIVEVIDVTSTDTPETIRTRLQELYARQDAKLTHALIIGDAADVPAKQSRIIYGVTDHYYRAIDTNDYSRDINGPDIGVGRVAVQNETDLANVLAKFTRYVHGNFNRESWLQDISFLATDDRWQIAEGTHNYVVDTHTAKRGYLGVFPNAEQIGGDKLYAITYRVSNRQVHETMGLGRTIINFSGHGATTFWAGPRVTQDDVRRLADPDALPFVISNACITGDFRVSESFAETWQRHPAGAIMFWGSMDNTYWTEDDVLERALYDGIFDHGHLQFAAITDYALAQHWLYFGGAGRSAYYWETYVTFGDPSLELRTTLTRNANLEGPRQLPVGAASATYRVVAEDAPVAGARVALSAGDHTFSGVTDTDGMVRFDLSTATRAPATFQLRATGNNLKLTAAELHIVP